MANDKRGGMRSWLCPLSQKIMYGNFNVVYRGNFNGILRKLKLIECVYVFFFFFGRVGDNLITSNS